MPVRLPTGPPPLTSRQREVLALLVQGRTNYEIAQTLGISLEGAKYHVREIMTRMNVESREQAVSAWRREQRFDRRLQRTLAGALSLGGLRWLPIALAGTAVAAVGIVAAVVVATRGDGSPPAADVPSISPTAASTADAQPTATAEPTGPYPVGTRTGIDVIDRVLEAVETGDPAEVAAQIAYYSRPCDNEAAIASLPCDAGDPVGTEYAVVGGGGGEGRFVRSIATDEIAELVTNFMTPIQPEFIGISRQSTGDIPGAYFILFSSGHELRLDDRGITWFGFPPLGPPETRFGANADFVLPPR